MSNMTLAVPDKLRKEMEEFPEINWSEIARQSFEERLELLKLLRKFQKKSTLTEEDAIRMGREVSEAAGKRFLALRPTKSS